MIPAVKRSINAGLTAEQAGAMSTAVQKYLGQADPESRISRTAIGQFHSQLKELLPTEDLTKDVLDEHGRTRTKLVRRGTGLTDNWKRIEYLQQNAAARKRFVAEANFEQGAGDVFAELLGEGKGRTQAYLKENLAAFTPRVGWGKLGEETLLRLDKTHEQMLDKVKRSQAATDEKLLTNAGGRAGAAAGSFQWEDLQKKLSGAGAGIGEQTEAWFRYKSGMSGATNEEAYLNEVRRAINWRRHRMSASFSTLEEAERVAEARPAAQRYVPTAKEQEHADDLTTHVKDMVALLYDIKVLEEKRLVAAEKQAQKPSGAAIQNNRYVHAEPVGPFSSVSLP